MALELRFNIQQSYNCKEFIFTETTGVYSAGNLTGWGAPNPLTSDATVATLTVTDPGGTSYVINLFTSDFPSSNNSTEYTITFDEIGGAANTAITDGIYTFLYTVTASDVTYTQTKISTLTCNVACCVYSMFKDIDFECDCAHDAKEKAIDAWILLKGLQSNCGTTADFETNLATLQRLCLNSNCANCH